jgi:hybrid cluster-associated redox disulfide protein
MAANTITKDMLIGDILEVDVEIAQFLFEIGMHCVGCPAARGESLEEACMVHDTDADELIDKINEYLSAKQ